MTPVLPVCPWMLCLEHFVLHAALSGLAISVGAISALRNKMKPKGFEGGETTGSDSNFTPHLESAKVVH